MLHQIFNIAHFLLTVLTYVIIVQVIVSWLFVLNVLNTRSGGVRTFAVALDRITAPLYRPIRAILPDFGGLDFSPIVLLILIQVVHMLLDGAESSLISYNS